MPIDLSAPTTGESLAAYLEDAYPGKFGGPPDRVLPTAVVTVNQFKLAERFPTLADVDALFKRTIVARATIEPQVNASNGLTHCQQMNFALFLGDTTNPSVVACLASMSADLKSKILAVRSLVTP
jgi:hypothetical protein